MLHLYQTHKIFAFYPAVTHFHGLEITSPWTEPNPMYPGPHHDLLRAHYQTSIFASLSAAVEPLDDDDDEELPELPLDFPNLSCCYCTKLVFSYHPWPTIFR